MTTAIISANPTTPPPPAPDAVPIAAPPPFPRSRMRSTVASIPRIGLVAAAIGVSFLIDNGIFTTVAFIFAIVVPLEKLYPRKKGQRIRRPMVGTDVAFALIGPLLNVAGLVAGLVIGGLSLLWLPGLALRPLVTQIPAWALPFVAFVVFDFIVYWTHRFTHEVPVLWRFHSVHHSPEHMDWISGFRIHPFDGILIAPAVVFILAAGVDGEVAGALAVIQIALGLFFHANVRLRLRWLDRILCNPEFHHWHHANEADAIGHNYGGALPILDLAFGTFFMPRGSRRPAHYGVDEAMPRTVGGLLLHPLRGHGLGRLVRHPLTSALRAPRAIRGLLGDVWESARRPTHSVRRATSGETTSTNASLFEPAEAPGRRYVQTF